MIKKLMKVAAFASLMLLAACSPKTEYTHALPKDASVVVAMDLEEMAEKAGLNGQEGKKVVDKLTTLLKGGLQGDAAQLAERIVQQPSESGLSFSEKVYLFATPHASAFAALAKVEDSGKLETLMETLVKESIASPLREESGCQWTLVGGALCAFNNGTFLLLQPAKGDASGMKGTLLSLMRQEEGEGFSALPEFTKVEAEGNDIASVVNLSAVPYEWTTPLRMGLSGDIRLEDIKYFVAANFEQGKVVVNSESLIENPKVQAFFDNMDKVMLPIEGKYLDFYPGKTMVWSGGHIEGKELYRMLAQNPTIKQVLDNPLLPVDVEEIFSAIEGDFAMGLDNPFANGNLLFYADVTRDDFLQMFEDLRPLLALTGGQIVLDNVGPNDYRMRTYYGTFWFGVKNQRLYVTTNRTWAEEIGRTYGASLSRKPWASEVKDNRMLMALNLEEMNNTLRQLPNAGMWGAAKFILSQCEYMTVGMPDWRHGEAELVLKDKNTNLLRWLTGLVENF